MGICSTCRFGHVKGFEISCDAYQSHKKPKDSCHCHFPSDEKIIINTGKECIALVEGVKFLRFNPETEVLRATFIRHNPPDKGCPYGPYWSIQQKACPE